MNIEGILVPIVTPFTADNQVDTTLLAELVDAFIAKGVRGIVACGTTGEYYALSEAERETDCRCQRYVERSGCTTRRPS